MIQVRPDRGGKIKHSQKEARSGETILSPNIFLRHTILLWSRVLIVAVIFVATLVLTGWSLNIEILKRWWPGLPAMNPTSAITFICSALALILLTRERPRKYDYTISYLFATVPLVVGVLKISETVFDIETHVDTFLFNDKLQTATSSWRDLSLIAPSTGLNFIMTGFALILIRFGDERRKFPSQYFSILVALLGLLSVLGYAYSVKTFYGILTYIPMAINTAISFLLLSLAILFANPDKGIMRKLTNPYAGSITARLLIPAAIVIPALLGYFQLMGVWSGIFTIEFGADLLVINMVIIFLLLTWHIMVSLNKRDILLRQTAEALHQSEEQIQTIFKAAPDAVIVIDDTGKIVKWNPKAEELFGWKASEVIGEPLVKRIIPIRYREAHQKGIQHFLETGKGPVLNTTVEITAINSANIEFDVSLSISPTLIDNKYLFIGFVRDITERKKAENEIRRINEFLDTILENIPNMIFVKEARELRFLRFNKAGEELLGYSKNDLIGKNDYDFFPPEQADFFISRDREVLSRGQLKDIPEEPISTKNGMRWLHTKKLPIGHQNGSPRYLLGISEDITDRKLAEEKLRESEERFRLLVESVKDYAIYLIDPTGHIVSWNNGAKQIKGYSAGEIIGKHISVFYTPEEVERGEPTHNLKMAAQLGRFEAEGLRVKKDGSSFWANVILTAIHNQAGQVQGFVKVTRDITEKKKADEAIRELNANLEHRIIERTAELRESEQKYRNLFENNPMPMWVMDVTTFSFLDINEAAVKHYGYTRDEFLSMSALDIRPPHEQERLINFDRSKYNGPYNAGRWKHIKKNREVIDVEITAHEIYFENRLARLVLSNDITDRLKAEKELIRSEKLFRTIVLSIPKSLVIIIDKDHRYQMVEGDIMEKLGYKKQNYEGRHPSEIFSPEQYENAKTNFERMLGGENFSLERDLNDDHFIVHYVPLKNENNSVYAGLIVALDISEIKNAQKEIVELNRNLEQKVTARTEQLTAANKELEAFSYSISHDLRAPLRAINGYALILKEEFGDRLDIEGMRILDIINTNTKRMGQLIDDLLTFARLGKKEISKSVLSMNVVANQVLTELTQSANNNKIKVNLHNLHNAAGDLSMIKQVWINLLGNALKYSSNNERVQIEIGSEENEKSVTYYVRDNGVGFDMQYSNKLFGVFQRLHTEDEFEGTGVGLAIVKRIISRHNGNIWAEGKVGEGATFYFTLPKK